MLRIASVFIVPMLLASCIGTKPITEKDKPSNIGTEQVYQVLVRFKSEEGLKRALYRLSNLSLELKEEVSASDFIYILQLKTKPYAINGTVEKIGLLNEVDWAKLAAP